MKDIEKVTTNKLGDDKPKHTLKIRATRGQPRYLLSAVVIAMTGDDFTIDPVESNNSEYDTYVSVGFKTLVRTSSLTHQGAELAVLYSILNNSLKESLRVPSVYKALSDFKATGFDEESDIAKIHEILENVH